MFCIDSENEAVHIVVDRHLVTGQNTNSTVMAVQNLILIANHRSVYCVHCVCLCLILIATQMSVCPVYFVNLCLSVSVGLYLCVRACIVKQLLDFSWLISLGCKNH